MQPVTESSQNQDDLSYTTPWQKKGWGKKECLQLIQDKNQTVHVQLLSKSLFSNITALFRKKDSSSIRGVKSKEIKVFRLIPTERFRQESQKLEELSKQKKLKSLIEELEKDFAPYEEMNRQNSTINVLKEEMKELKELITQALPPSKTKTPLQVLSSQELELRQTAINEVRSQLLELQNQIQEEEKDSGFKEFKSLDSQVYRIKAATSGILIDLQNLEKEINNSSKDLNTLTQAIKIKGETFAEQVSLARQTLVQENFLRKKTNQITLQISKFSPEIRKEWQTNLDKWLARGKLETSPSTIKNRENELNQLIEATFSACHQEVNNLIQKSKENLESNIKNHYSEGYSAGRETGLDKLKEELLATRLQEWNTLAQEHITLENLGDWKSRVEKNFEDDEMLLHILNEPLETKLLKYATNIWKAALSKIPWLSDPMKIMTAVDDESANKIYQALLKIAESGKLLFSLDTFPQSDELLFFFNKLSQQETCSLDELDTFIRKTSEKTRSWVKLQNNTPASQQALKIDNDLHHLSNCIKILIHSSMKKRRTLFETLNADGLQFEAPTFPPAINKWVKAKFVNLIHGNSWNSRADLGQLPAFWTTWRSNYLDSSDYMKRIKTLAELVQKNTLLAKEYEEKIDTMSGQEKLLAQQNLKTLQELLDIEHSIPHNQELSIQSIKELEKKFNASTSSLKLLTDKEIQKKKMHDEIREEIKKYIVILDTYRNKIQTMERKYGIEIRSLHTILDDRKKAIVLWETKGTIPRGLVLSYVLYFAESKKVEFQNLSLEEVSLYVASLKKVIESEKVYLKQKTPILDIYKASEAFLLQVTTTENQIREFGSKKLVNNEISPPQIYFAHVLETGLKAIQDRLKTKLSSAQSKSLSYEIESAKDELSSLTKKNILDSERLPLIVQLKKFSSQKEKQNEVKALFLKMVKEKIHAHKAELNGAVSLFDKPEFKSEATLIVDAFTKKLNPLNETIKVKRKLREENISLESDLSVEELKFYEATVDTLIKEGKTKIDLLKKTNDKLLNAEKKLESTIKSIKKTGEDLRGKNQLIHDATLKKALRVVDQHKINFLKEQGIKENNPAALEEIPSTRTWKQLGVDLSLGAVKLPFKTVYYGVTSVPTAVTSTFHALSSPIKTASNLKKIPALFSESIHKNEKQKYPLVVSTAKYCDMIGDCVSFLEAINLKANNKREMPEMPLYTQLEQTPEYVHITNAAELTSYVGSSITTLGNLIYKKKRISLADLKEKTPDLAPDIREHYIKKVNATLKPTEDSFKAKKDLLKSPAITKYIPEDSTFHQELLQELTRSTNKIETLKEEYQAPGTWRYRGDCISLKDINPAQMKAHDEEVTKASKELELNFETISHLSLLKDKDNAFSTKLKEVRKKAENLKTGGQRYYAFLLNQELNKIEKKINEFGYYSPIYSSQDVSNICVEIENQTTNQLEKANKDAIQYGNTKLSNREQIDHFLKLGIPSSDLETETVELRKLIIEDVNKKLNNYISKLDDQEAKLTYVSNSLNLPQKAIRSLKNTIKDQKQELNRYLLKGQTFSVKNTNWTSFWSTDDKKIEDLTNQEILEIKPDKIIEDLGEIGLTLVTKSPIGEFIKAFDAYEKLELKAKEVEDTLTTNKNIYALYKHLKPGITAAKAWYPKLYTDNETAVLGETAILEDVTKNFQKAISLAEDTGFLPIPVQIQMLKTVSNEAVEKLRDLAIEDFNKDIKKQKTKLEQFKRKVIISLSSEIDLPSSWQIHILKEIEKTELEVSAFSKGLRVGQDSLFSERQIIPIEKLSVEQIDTFNTEMSQLSNFVTSLDEEYNLNRIFLKANALKTNLESANTTIQEKTKQQQLPTATKLKETISNIKKDLKDFYSRPSTLDATPSFPKENLSPGELNIRAGMQRLLTELDSKILVLSSEVQKAKSTTLPLDELVKGIDSQTFILIRTATIEQSNLKITAVLKALDEFKPRTEKINKHLQKLTDGKLYLPTAWFHSLNQKFSQDRELLENYMRNFEVRIGKDETKRVSLHSLSPEQLIEYDREVRELCEELDLKGRRSPTSIVNYYNERLGIRHFELQVNALIEAIKLSKQNATSKDNDTDLNKKNAAKFLQNVHEIQLEIVSRSIKNIESFVDTYNCSTSLQSAVWILNENNQAFTENRKLTFDAWTELKRLEEEVEPEKPLNQETFRAFRDKLINGYDLNYKEKQRDERNNFIYDDIKKEYREISKTKHVDGFLENIDKTQKYLSGLKDKLTKAKAFAETEMDSLPIEGQEEVMWTLFNKIKKLSTSLTLIEKIENTHKDKLEKLKTPPNVDILTISGILDYRDQIQKECQHIQSEVYKALVFEDLSFSFPLDLVWA